VVEGIGYDFAKIEKAILELFLPALFLDKLEECDPRGSLSKLPMKFTGLALPHPVASSKSNFEASTLMCSHLLLAVFRGVETFSLAEQLSVQKAVTVELKLHQAATYDSTLDSILNDLDCNTPRTFPRGKETGQWLSVMATTLNGTKLSPKSFGTCFICSMLGLLAIFHPTVMVAMLI
jgi:hypothetical protein